MSLHVITFGFEVSGNIVDLQVFANGVPVGHSRSGGKIIGGFRNARIQEGSNLLIEFFLTGLNGTAYEIAYQFVDNNIKEDDPSKPSPIKNSIAQNMLEKEVVNFKI